MEITPDMRQAMITHLRNRLHQDLETMRLLNETKAGLEYDIEEKGLIINKLRDDIRTLEGKTSEFSRTKSKDDDDDKSDDDKYEFDENGICYEEGDG